MCIERPLRLDNFETTIYGHLSVKRGASVFCHRAEKRKIFVLYTSARQLDFFFYTFGLDGFNVLTHCLLHLYRIRIAGGRMDAVTGKDDAYAYASHDESGGRTNAGRRAVALAAGSVLPHPVNHVGLWRIARRLARHVRTHAATPRSPSWDNRRF